VLAGIFAISFTGDELGLGAITKIYFLYSIVLKGILSFTEFWIFLGISFGGFVLTYLFVFFTYQGVTTLVNTHRTRRNYKLKGVKTRSQFSALLAKEARKFFTTPLYVMNSLLGYVFAILASVIVMVMFFGDNSEFGYALGQVFSTFAPCVFALTMMMSPPTSCAVSLEGKSLWIMTTSPIKTTTLFNAKLVLTYIMAGLTAIISSILLGIAFRLEFWIFALNFIIAIGFAVFSANIGLLFDLIFAKFSWTKEQQVIKQGLPIVLCIFLGMAITGLLIVIPIKLEISRYLFFGAVAGFITLASLLTYLFIMKKGEKLIFKKV
jgi:ABC-2 type transport system permease protein